MKIAKSLVLCLLLINPATAFAQVYSLSGHVIDPTTGMGVPNVVVTVATKTSTTDENGRYSINDVPSGERTIDASSPNFVIDRESIIVSESVADQILPAYAGKTIPVPVLAARKDTKLLCLDGCHRIGDELHASWNASREFANNLSDHDIGYCAFTQIAMINRYFGGNVSRDEIASIAKRRATPEEELGHGWAGANFQEAAIAYRDVLNGAAGSEELTSRPSNSRVKECIDSGRLICWNVKWTGNTGHAMVVAGYRYKDGKFEMQFLNTDNNGLVEWLENGPTYGTFFSGFVVPQSCQARNANPLVDRDSDGDGVSDYDEIKRWDGKFDLDENNPDTDGDGLPDGKDIEGWLFRGQNTAVGQGKFDDDKDGLRGEVDPDSDNGGVRDGDEDFNFNANKDKDETDPYDPLQPNADDIPKVKITLEPSTKAAGKTKVTGKTTATFLFLRKDGSTDLRVFDEKAGPLTVQFTPEGGTAVTVKLTPTGDLPTATWTGELEITSKTPVGKAEFQVKNGASDVEIIEGKEFYISLDGAKSLIKE